MLFYSIAKSSIAPLVSESARSAARSRSAVLWVALRLLSLSLLLLLVIIIISAKVCLLDGALARHWCGYTRSPSQDFRLFGPRPWKILRHYLWTNGFLSNPAPNENLVSGNLVMEIRCMFISMYSMTIIIDIVITIIIVSCYSMLRLVC